MIVLGIPLTDTAMRRRMPRAWPWVKDALAGVAFVAFTMSIFWALDEIAALMQAAGWAG